jgi:hypothetical protein
MIWGILFKLSTNILERRRPGQEEAVGATAQVKSETADGELGETNDEAAECTAPELASFTQGAAADPSPAAKRAGLAAWLTLALCAIVVWADTISQDHKSFLLRGMGVVIILLLIYALEAIELALAELEDKEIESAGQLQGRQQALRILREYGENSEAYLRAREWCFAALIICITLVVERGTYYVPFVGTVQGGIFRFAITVVLGTIAVVWFAQSPGKMAGRSNSIQFLDLLLLPTTAHILVLKVKHWSERLSIDEPSDVASAILNNILGLQNPQVLPPANNRIFTELARRYGYADCNVIEEIEIRADGSISLTQIEEVYLSRETKSYRRQLTLPVEFLSEPSVTVNGFVIGALSGPIDIAIEKWRTAPRRNCTVRCRTEFPDPKNRKVVVVNVGIRTTLGIDEAVYLRIEAKSMSQPSAFSSNNHPGEDYWRRSPVKPCFRAHTTLRLVDCEPKANFSEPIFEVKVDNLPHSEESARFMGLQVQPSVLQEEAKVMQFDLTYALPGAQYEVRWKVEN